MRSHPLDSLAGARFTADNGLRMDLLSSVPLQASKQGDGLDTQFTLSEGAILHFVSS